MPSGEEKSGIILILSNKLRLPSICWLKKKKKRVSLGLVTDLLSLSVERESTDTFLIQNCFSTQCPSTSASLSLFLCLDGPGASQEVVWLTDVPAAMEFIAATEVAVIGFFQVCPDTPLAVLPKKQKCSISKAMTVTCWPDDTA